ncbi:MAG: SRPBCC family protein [Pseudonocardiales bacterium]|nr:MAG: SRPBCC family protein [Pseudonocardiales bacterium]
MTKWHEMQPADGTFFQTAPYIYRFPIDLPVPPERVWESLTSERSVAAWGPGVQSLRWTSPRPFGVGTTREVVLPLRSITVIEQYFRWDEGKGYSFFVREANRAVLRRMAEDYLLEPSASGCRFTWTFAIEPTAKSAPLLRVGDPVNKLAFGQMARRSKSYFVKHPRRD